MCRLVIQGGKARYRDLDLNRALCEELLILDLRRGPEAIAHNPPLASWDLEKDWLIPSNFLCWTRV